MNTKKLIELTIILIGRIGCVLFLVYIITGNKLLGIFIVTCYVIIYMYAIFNIDTPTDVGEKSNGGCNKWHIK